MLSAADREAVVQLNQKLAQTHHHPKQPNSQHTARSPRVSAKSTPQSLRSPRVSALAPAHDSPTQKLAAVPEVGRVRPPPLTMPGFCPPLPRKPAKQRPDTSWALALQHCVSPADGGSTQPFSAYISSETSLKSGFYDQEAVHAYMQKTSNVMKTPDVMRGGYHSRLTSINLKTQAGPSATSLDDNWRLDDNEQQLPSSPRLARQAVKSSQREKTEYFRMQAHTLERDLSRLESIVVSAPHRAALICWQDLSLQKNMLLQQSVRQSQQTPRSKFLVEPKTRQHGKMLRPPSTPTSPIGPIGHRRTRVTLPAAAPMLLESPRLPRDTITPETSRGQGRSDLVRSLPMSCYGGMQCLTERPATRGQHVWNLWY